MADHSCTQSVRFDNMEDSLAKAHGKLDQITDILIANARTEERLKTLEAFKDGAEPRIKAVEDFIAHNAWVIRLGERVVWAAILVALAFFKLKGG